ncbi:MAG: hypothetical protein ACQET7_15645, partial [Thermodesulfobacteriota bacterium]
MRFRNSGIILPALRGLRGGIKNESNKDARINQPSFHPEMVFFANLGVNLRGCLCGVLQYASAQPL